MTGQLLNSLQDETGELTSTTGLDFETFDGHTEFTTDDDDLSTTIDTTDAHAIRRQLESLESMYTEVCYEKLTCRQCDSCHIPYL